MLSDFLLPQRGGDGVYRFKMPIGRGAVPFVHLGDFGRYAEWIYSHPSESNGIVLGIAIEHVSGPELARAFTAVTGNAAEYVDQPAMEWIEAQFGHLPQGVNTKVGISSVKDPNALLMTFGENFNNWWNLYKASADNKGLIQRDYALLDRILPDRAKSLEEWMRQTGYDASRQSVIKTEERRPPVQQV